MSPRPTSISTEDLVQVARGLFLEEGLAVSTSKIARTAGISEGSIFKRFSTKRELFLAAMNTPSPEWGDLLRTPVTAGGLRDRLEAIGLTLVAFYRRILPQFMLMRSHPDYDPITMFRGQDDAPPLRVTHALADFIARQHEAELMHTPRPDVVAGMLLGAFHNLVFFEVMGLTGPQVESAEARVKVIVDTLLRGVQAPPFGQEGQRGQ